MQSFRILKGVWGWMDQVLRILPLHIFSVIVNYYTRSWPFPLAFLYGEDYSRIFFSVHVHILYIHTFYKNDIEDAVFAVYVPLRILVLKLKYRHMSNYFDLLSLLLNGL